MKIQIRVPATRLYVLGMIVSITGKRCSSSDPFAHDWVTVEIHGGVPFDCTLLRDCKHDVRILAD